MTVKTKVFLLILAFLALLGIIGVIWFIKTQMIDEGVGTIVYYLGDS